MMSQRVWTEQEHLLVEATVDHWTIEEQARQLRRTVSSVRHYRERHGFYPTRYGGLTSSGAARVLGKSPQHLTALAREGRISAHRVPGGRWWIFDLDEHDEFSRMREAFVTPHARQRFRERIRSRVTDAEIEAVIRLALARPHGLRRRDLRDGTPSLMVRAKNLSHAGITWSFRLALVPGRFPARPPVVLTVLH